MRKRRANWDNIGVGVMFTTAACFMGYVGFDTLEDRLNGQDLSAPVLEQDGFVYTLVNASTVLKKSGKISFSFDFAERHILIKGTLNEEKFTGYSTFEGFGRPAEITAATEAGCSLARTWAARAAAFDPGYILAPGDRTATRTIADTTSAFLRDYCAP